MACVISPDKERRIRATRYGVVNATKFASEMGKDFGWSTVHFSIVLRNPRNIAQLGQHLADDPLEGSSGLAIQGPKPVLILISHYNDKLTFAIGKICFRFILKFLNPKTWRRKLIYVQKSFL